MRNYADLLTQTAVVTVRSQSFDAKGAEVVGATQTLYAAEPCRVFPVSAEKAAARGLDLDSENSLVFFAASVSLTRDTATGQDYQDVDILVDNVHYSPVRPQTLVGMTEINHGDLCHVEVPCIRRS